MTDKTPTPDSLVKPGYTTTEFWVTLLTVAASAAGVLDPNLHLSGYVQGASVAVSGLATIVYAAVRYGVKREVISLARSYAQSIQDAGK
jgi:hypothetical protein